MFTRVTIDIVAAVQYVSDRINMAINAVFLNKFFVATLSKNAFKRRFPDGHYPV